MGQGGNRTNNRGMSWDVGQLCVSASECAYESVHVSAYVCECVCACACECALCECVYYYVSVFVHVSVYICECVCACACECICMRVHVCM